VGETMSYIMVDIEADGPIPGDYSMISFGAIVVEPSLSKTFYAQIKPISHQWIPEALQVSQFTREETLTFEAPEPVMQRFATWIATESSGKPFFISDNNGFDWQFINWYFHHFYGSNPFGHSSTNLGSLYKGLMKDTFVNFKHLRKSPHTHHALDDARGNAEALLHLKYELGLKINLS
jgi:3' exoribonuclease, RNase T-like